jgi:hypothetical protein
MVAFQIVYDRIKSGHVNNKYDMAPGQTSYSGPKSLPITT